MLFVSWYVVCMVVCVVCVYMCICVVCNVIMYRLGT